MFRFFSALLTVLDHLEAGAAEGKVDGSKVCCLLHSGDLPVVGAFPVAWAVLLGQCCHKAILVIGRGGQVCRDTILEHKGPRLMPLSGVAQLYNSVAAGLDSGQLARVVLELLGLMCGCLSLFRLECRLGQLNGGCWWSAWSFHRGPWFCVTLRLAW